MQFNEEGLAGAGLEINPLNSALKRGTSEKPLMKLDTRNIDNINIHASLFKIAVLLNTQMTYNLTQAC